MFQVKRKVKKPKKILTIWIKSQPYSTTLIINNPTIVKKHSVIKYSQIPKILTPISYFKVIILSTD